ncbi:hypothetical protein BJ138DRAFT_1062591 [Hygrophoropsis aurantiaca]|uniref:Uncharacterized protein n=1 Tax=Hygrophoropsis aurantiaca TaxID=72124 RepID=A0ACB8AEZ1_9AGAM|nr:hypothetical protein BJ138DRAFT_1062591 [Hygrophoropsis aurantiaca]
MSGLSVETSIPLPSDVFILIMQHLTYDDMLTLRCTCKLLYALVHEYGWSAYLRLHDRPSFSLRKARYSWDALTRARYDALSDRAWSKARSIARPLSRPWAGKLQPHLAMSPSRLLVAAGSKIYAFKIKMNPKKEYAPGMISEATYILNHPDRIKRDITSLVFTPDDGLDRTVFAGFANGAIERIVLPIISQDEASTVTIYLPQDSYTFHGGDLIESMSCSGNSLLSVSSLGLASLCNLTSHPLTPSFINLHCKSWCSYLSLKASSPFTAFGISSASPLSVYPITGNSLSKTPSAHLQSRNPRKFSAVYGISGAPISSPWGGSENILISGWYDGAVCVHDLRSSSRTSQDDIRGTAPLLPVLSLEDPWCPEPIYSVGCGGGSSSHIAAGSARHSVVAFWDVRSPSRGWSIHAPGNDVSPVYSVILESSRLFGATQSRPFVYDFGPGVTEATYPVLPPSPNRLDDTLRMKKNGPGYYVTRYNHRRTQE